MVIKSRFCPSPTGRLHLGNIRTALISWLYARSQLGAFLLRIEDTDKERSTDEYAKMILQDLALLGLKWDEGPQGSVDDALYYQSNRSDFYNGYYQQLLSQGMAYPCFCSSDLLKRTRKRQLADGKPPRYPGTCAHLTVEEIAQKRASGEQEVLRFSVSNEEIEFFDVVKGRQLFRGSDISDFIIRKNDGTPTFMFCNAVDDALMGVTMVIRGEDHLTNSPRQISILQSLDLPVPQYCHLATVLGSDGTPLSKRNGSVGLEELVQKGYHPLAICNYLARLGHVYESNELYTMEQLATHFNLEKLGTSASHNDIQQLDYWQKKTVESMDNESLSQWLGDVLTPYTDNYPISDLINFVRSNIRFPQDATPWLAMLSESFDYSSDARTIITDAEDGFFDMAATIVTTDDYKNSGWKLLPQQLQQQTGIKGKKLYLPLRAALTGAVTGPELQPLATLIGNNNIQLRLHKAANIQQER